MGLFEICLQTAVLLKSSSLKDGIHGINSTDFFFKKTRNVTEISG